MKKLFNKIMPCLALMLSASISFAQDKVEMADQMRSNGKIYVIVGIILIVLSGLIVYLFVMDRKVKRLERRLTELRGPQK
jgi:uncharacterized integral membrane protein